MRLGEKLVHWRTLGFYSGFIQMSKRTLLRCEMSVLEGRDLG